MTPEELAILFHETYERLAPSFGYETRAETRKFDPSTANGRLMIAVCGAVVTAIKDSVFATGFQAGAELKAEQIVSLVGDMTIKQSSPCNEIL